MKKIATITFHAPYNYGSNLQAYALQEYIKKIGGNEVDYKIINLRTDIQKEAYTSYFKRKGIKNLIRRVLFWGQKEALDKRAEYFEKFIQQNLNLTDEYTNIQQIKDANLDFDYYISGSDQLWNTAATDFDWSYFLEFVKKGKKVSYAASFGPIAPVWTAEDKQRIAHNLQEYDCLSVREMGSFKNVKELTGKEPEINIDPTLFLTKEEWEKIIPEKPLINSDYILFYNLKKSKEPLQIAKKISKILNMPVIITKAGFAIEVFYGFERKFDVGPIEFLNLIKNAKLVLSSSYHGVIFSILLNTPFFAINGKKDFRISTLLEKVDLQDRSIDINSIEEKCKRVYDIDFSKSVELLKEERLKSRDYLERALDLK